jgi:hypothetical protein
MPVSVAEAVPPGLALTVSVAASSPFALGEKETVIEHEAPAASVPVQVSPLLTVKSEALPPTA